MSETLKFNRLPEVNETFTSISTSGVLYTFQVMEYDSPSRKIKIKCLSKVKTLNGNAVIDGGEF